jgi:hypothetical protein
MPDSAHPPDTHDLDERVRALEEYLKANPPTTPMPASPSRSGDYTGGMVVEFPHTSRLDFHLSFRQAVGIATAVIAVAGIILFLTRPWRKSGR